MDMDKLGALRVKMTEAMAQQTVDGTIPVAMRLPLGIGIHPTIMVATRAAGTTATRTPGRLVVMLLLLLPLLVTPPRPTLGFDASHMPNPPSRS